MRAFGRVRQLLAAHSHLARLLDELEPKYDAPCKAVFDAIRQLMTSPREPRRPPVGYHTEALPVPPKRRGR